MKLATLRDGSRDGQLVVVSRDLTIAHHASHIASRLQQALDDWGFIAPQLNDLYVTLNEGRQGGSDDLLGPMEDIVCADEAWGIDFEAEVAVVTDDVPMGTAAAAAGAHVRLVMLVNDVSLRNLIPPELAKGFGFFQSKPATAFSPVAVTPDELGEAWDGRKLNLPLVVHWNGERVGSAHAGTDMVFDFPQLIAHAARTRNLRAGSIVGSGTVSNKDASRGYSCIAEKRALEMIADSKPSTEFMKYGDRVRIEMFDGAGRSIFGAIDQKVAAAGRR